MIFSLGSEISHVPIFSLALIGYFFSLGIAYFSSFHSLNVEVFSPVPFLSFLSRIYYFNIIKYNLLEY